MVAAERVLGGLRCSEESLFLNIPYDSSFIFPQLCNAFVRLKSQPTPRDMEQIYRRLTDLLPDMIPAAPRTVSRPREKPQRNAAHA
jgi:hypothetical protein